MNLFIPFSLSLFIVCDFVWCRLQCRCIEKQNWMTAVGMIYCFSNEQQENACLSMWTPVAAGRCRCRHCCNFVINHVFTFTTWKSKHNHQWQWAELEKMWNRLLWFEYWAFQQRIKRVTVAINYKYRYFVEHELFSVHKLGRFYNLFYNFCIRTVRVCAIHRGAQVSPRVNCIVVLHCCCCHT